ncbi:MAG: hypothetical protein Q4C04_03575 [Clostridia bacterium]|nr:hypothetical protein [Clostridia bacterium]
MLEKFTVIDLIKTRSASVATLNGGAVKFNSQTPAELHYPPFVQFLIQPKDKQFAIRACNADAPNAVKFSKPEGEQRYPIKVSFPVAVDMIRKLMGWAQDENWNVPGIYFADEQALVYDLSSAYRPTARGGWTVKRQQEEAAKAAEQAIDADN